MAKEIKTESHFGTHSYGTYIPVPYFLSNKRRALVLDNFEQLIDSSPLLLDILTAALNVQLLVTSRQSLNLQAEWLYEVEGLPYPSPDTTKEIKAYNAVQLFLQHAHRVNGRVRLPGAIVCRLSRTIVFTGGQLGYGCS